MKIKFSVLLIVLLALVLNSCAANNAVMKYGNAELSERIYGYWLLQYKSYFMSAYSDITDDDEFWNSTISEDSTMTLEQYFTDIADINIKKNLVCLKMFEEYGLTVPDETYEQVDLEIQDHIDSYGSKNEFNKMLAEYGINDKIYREIYIIQEKIAILFNHLFGENGARPITNEEVEEYYLNNYILVKYITINLYDVTEDGTFTEISAEESEIRTAHAENIYNEILNGADFNEMYDLYTDDMLEDYPNGVYFSNSNAGSHGVIDAALSIEIGDVNYVADTYVIYIVKRMELEDKPYNNDAVDQLQFTDLYTLCAESVYQNILYEHIDEIEIIESVKGDYSIRGQY